MNEVLERENRRSLPENFCNRSRVVYDAFEANPAQRATPGHPVDPASGMPWPYYAPTDPSDDTLVFESRFESGNLRRAVHVPPYEYDLSLRTDVYTNGYTQWFYFAITNMRKDIEYTINITNLYKSESQYSQGLRPVMYSEKRAERENLGWFRCGEDIAYFANSQRRSESGGYTLTFKVTFPYADDTCYLAHCYPYTWTRLQRQLAALEHFDTDSSRVRREKLCNTLAGNRVDLLTITNFKSSPAEIAARKGVMLTSRVHPGETGASWMMEGMTKYLVSDTPRASELRNNFVFKVVPMLNPDGVINGNYRCSLAGVDLNRQWKSPHSLKHRPIYCAKEVIRELCAEREVLVYCDLHGHSSKNNVFIYGCESHGSKRYMERVFPMLLAQICDIFSYEDCHFHIRKDKENCGRVAVHREFSILNSFTMEASFAGASIGPGKGLQFNTCQYQAMGCKFMDALLFYNNGLSRPDGGRVADIYAHILSTEGNPAEEEKEREPKRKGKAKCRQLRRTSSVAGANGARVLKRVESNKNRR